MSTSAKLQTLTATAAAVLALTMAAVVLPTTPAQAHVVYTDAYVYRSSSFCLQGDDEVSHGSSGIGGFAMAVTIPKWNLWGSYCSRNILMAARSIGVAKVLWKWNGYRSRWEVCRSYDWKFNAEPAKKIGYKHDYQRTPCGSGYYAVTGYHRGTDGRTWVSGFLNTHYHWWPTR